MLSIFLATSRATDAYLLNYRPYCLGLMAQLGYRAWLRRLLMWLAYDWEEIGADILSFIYI